MSTIFGSEIFAPVSLLYSFSSVDSTRDNFPPCLDFDLDFDFLCPFLLGLSEAEISYCDEFKSLNCWPKFRGSLV